MGKKQDIDEPLTRFEQIQEAKRLANDIQQLQARAKNMNMLMALPLVKIAATKQSTLNLLLVGLL